MTNLIWRMLFVVIFGNSHQKFTYMLGYSRRKVPRKCSVVINVYNVVNFTVEACYRIALLFSTLVAIGAYFKFTSKLCHETGKVLNGVKQLHTSRTRENVTHFQKTPQTISRPVLIAFSLTSCDSMAVPAVDCKNSTICDFVVSLARRSPPNSCVI